MARFSEGPYNYVHWGSVSNALSELQEARPFACGLALLEDSRSGFAAVPRTLILVALQQEVTALYKEECQDSRRWQALEQKLEQELKYLDTNTNRVGGEPISKSQGVWRTWREYKGFAALLDLVLAAQAHLSGNGKSWRDNMAQAYLDCASWMGDIAYSRSPLPAQPSSRLYETRIREIAAYERALDVADAARESRCDLAHSHQFDLLRQPLEDCRQAIVAAQAAEERRVAALPLHRRWYHHVKEAFANSAG